MNREKISQDEIPFVLARPLVSKNGQNIINSILHLMFSVDTEIERYKNDAESYAYQLLQNICKIKTIIYDQIYEIGRSDPKLFMERYVKLIIFPLNILMGARAEYYPSNTLSFEKPIYDFQCFMWRVSKKSSIEKGKQPRFYRFQNIMLMFRKCKICSTKYLDATSIRTTPFLELESDISENIRKKYELAENEDLQYEKFIDKKQECCNDGRFQDHEHRLLILADVLFFIIRPSPHTWHSNMVDGVEKIPLKFTIAMKKYELKGFIIDHWDGENKQFTSTFLRENGTWYQQIDYLRKKVLDIEYFLTRKSDVRITAYEIIKEKD